MLVIIRVLAKRRSPYTVVHPDTTPMSPFGRKAASNALAAGTKKSRYKTGLLIFGSGGRNAFPPPLRGSVMSAGYANLGAALIG
jgi:hypothetical protein